MSARFWTPPASFVPSSSAQNALSESSYNSKRPSDPSSSTSLSTSTSMRSFQVKGLFGVTATFTTRVPGKLHISFPTFRARSEPPPTDTDVEMGPPEPEPSSNLHRSRSEMSIRIPLNGLTPNWSTHDTQAFFKEQEDEEELAEVRKPLRAPSLAETEVEDPDSQDIVVAIKRRGVKVKDFAYPPEPPAPSSPSSSLPVASTPTPPPRVPEIFDHMRALGEVDFQWSIPERHHPIRGQTLRRLIQCGLLSEAEVQTRGHPIDIAELARFDANPSTHPWKTFFRTPPTLVDRRNYLKVKLPMYIHLEHQMNLHQMELEKNRRDQEAMALAAERVAQREREAKMAEESKSKGGSGSKRRIGDDDDMNASSSCDAAEGNGNGSAPKRRRLTPEPPSSSSPFQSQPLPLSHPQALPANFYPDFLVPTKQYPAPLHTYDPEIYPDAASIIESSSQSQPRPVVPERVDTPPLDEEEKVRGPEYGIPLVHPKKNKAKGLTRALSRSRTFAQL